MRETTELQAAIMAAHERLIRALGGLDDATLETEPALGAWSARDVATHLSDWIEELLLGAEAALSAEQFPGRPSPTARRSTSPAWRATWETVGRRRGCGWTAR